MVIDARYQGLDAIAITGHRQTLDAKWGRWFSERIGGPIVLVGEEIPEIPHHVIAVGIHTTVDSALPVRRADRRNPSPGRHRDRRAPGQVFLARVRAGDGSARRHRDLSSGDLRLSTDAQAGASRNSRGGRARRRSGRPTFMVPDDSVCAGRSCSCARPARPGSSRRFARDERWSTDATARCTAIPSLMRIAEADGRLPAEARTDYPLSLLDRLSQILGIAGLAGLVVIERATVVALKGRRIARRERAPDRQAAASRQARTADMNADVADTTANLAAVDQIDERPRRPSSTADGPGPSPARRVAPPPPPIDDEHRVAEHLGHLDRRGFVATSRLSPAACTVHRPARRGPAPGAAPRAGCASRAASSHRTRRAAAAARRAVASRCARRAPRAARPAARAAREDTAHGPD